MAMRMGLLGRKLGMTQVFAEDGERIPVTVIETGPCVIVEKRTQERDGYTGVILGFDEKPEKRTNRPDYGLFKKAKVKPQRWLQEFRLPAEDVDKYEIGQTLRPSDVFEDGIPVDVVGTSKGKGFQGVIKRHGMHGTKATHGVHEVYRHGGSIGCRLTPGHVFKGKRMAGQMGNVRVTQQNLQLIQVLDDDNCVLVRGSIPGAKNSYVAVKHAATRTAYKRVGMGSSEERSKNPLKASKKAAAGR